MNRNLAKYVTTPEPGTRKSLKKTIKSTNKSEVLHFYGIIFFLKLIIIALIIRLENTYSNDSHDIRKHFKMLKERFGGIKKLGLDRFQLLRRCFNPTIEELLILAQIIGENSQKY